MQRLFSKYIPILFIGALGYGCSGPRLATRPLTAEEESWAQAMRAWHPEWKQPYLSPSRPTPPASGSSLQSRPQRTPTEPVKRAASVRPMPELPVLSQGIPGDDETVVLVPMEGGARPTVTGSRLYQVQKGDTLTAIALKHYGQAGAWRAILEANRDKLDAPDQLRAGSVLIIPEKN